MRHDGQLAAGTAPRFPLSMGASLPSARRSTASTYAVIAFAFPIWTFAIIAGAIWAESAWGRYWGWDPKETWSFITWVLYAGYLHARATAGWKGTKAAWIGVAAAVALIIDYYVVNIRVCPDQAGLAERPPWKQSMPAARHPASLGRPQTC